MAMEDEEVGVEAEDMVEEEDGEDEAMAVDEDGEDEDTEAGGEDEGDDTGVDDRTIMTLHHLPIPTLAMMTVA